MIDDRRVEPSGGTPHLGRSAPDAPRAGRSTTAGNSLPGRSLRAAARRSPRPRRNGRRGARAWLPTAGTRPVRQTECCRAACCRWRSKWASNAGRSPSDNASEPPETGRRHQRVQAGRRWERDRARRTAPGARRCRAGRRGARGDRRSRRTARSRAPMERAMASSSSDSGFARSNGAPALVRHTTVTAEQEPAEHRLARRGAARALRACTSMSTVHLVDPEEDHAARACEANGVAERPRASATACACHASARTRSAQKRRPFGPRSRSRSAPR